MNVDDTDYDSPSLSSSRSASPTPSFDDYAVPGNKAMDLYDTMLPKWRAAPRRWLLPLIRKESQILAKMQEKIRTPWLDAYFVYTSSLGTHTFFMTTLPACFWFGYTDLARGLLSALSIGVYCSSVVKDLFCSPRPFSPPVTRLTMGSHHLEYGFPSTHSTNSISIALLLFAYIYDLTYPPLSSTPTTLSPTTFFILSLILAIYAFSIVFGRLYTAMHSFTDCFCGVFLGTAIWWVSSSWNGIPIHISSLSSSPITIHLGRGLGMETYLWNWVSNGTWEVPLILIPLCLFLVHQHPQPVDDCPCFEDAIAFASVFFGALVGDWVKRHSGLKEVMERVAIMPGSGWVLDVGRGWIQVERGWLDYLTWWSAATLKMTIGIMVIFTWRLLAKSALHLILPPLFRLCARAFRLPNRRFYTPATEYKSVPSEFAMTKQGVGVLHPIPSLIDLPGSVGFDVDVDVDVDVGERKGKGKRVRIVNGGVFNGNEKIGKVVNVDGKRGGLHVTFDHDEEEDNKGQGVKHYDADVLTKVIVYAGIAFISIEVLPASFGLLGLGVKSWM